MAGLNPCNVLANAGAFGCRAKARQAVAGFVAASRFDLCIDLCILLDNAAPRKAATILFSNVNGKILYQNEKKSSSVFVYKLQGIKIEFFEHMYR